MSTFYGERMLRIVDPEALSVGAAARLLGSTPRMLRYREALGLVGPKRTPSGYRTYDGDDIRAASLAADLEQRHQVPPVALAFALRALDDPVVAAELHLLGRLARRREAPSIAALDFEQEKALRLLARAS